MWPQYDSHLKTHTLQSGLVEIKIRDSNTFKHNTQWMTQYDAEAFKTPCPGWSYLHMNK